MDNRGDKVGTTVFGMSAEAQAMRVWLSRQSIASFRESQVTLSG
jgi:hypothetical protein